MGVAIPDRVLYCEGMTERTEPAPLIGGPLNGQTYHSRTRWPSYLSNAGQSLASKKGDRVFSDRTNLSEVQSCYILRRDTSKPGHPRRYVHSTARDVL